MALALRWRPVPPPLALRWRGPDLSPAAVPARPGPSPIATVIGPPGASAAAAVRGSAAEVVGGHRAVAALGDGRFRAVGPGDPLADAVIGLTMHAAAAGGTLDVQTAGPVTEPAWTWAPGPVWVGPGGVPTQARPAAGALVRLGDAITATTILLSPRLVARIGE